MTRRRAALASALLAGCATYETKPVDPVRTEAEFRARTLADPSLAEFLRAHREDSAPQRVDGPLDLTSLTWIAWRFHPDVETARARVREGEAALVTAGARPNPTFTLANEYSTDAPSGTSPWSINPAVNFLIETGGKRAARIDVARRLGDARVLELAETAWRVRSRVRRALAAHLLALRRLDAVRVEEAARADAFARIEKRRDAGDASELEVSQVRVPLAATRLRLRAEEGRAAESRVALADALGLPVSALDGAQLAWPGLESPPPERAIPLAAAQRAGVLNRLDVRRTLADYAAAEASLELEVAKQYPDVTLGPGYHFDQGENKLALGIGFDLPIFQHHEGPIAEAAARREQAASRVLAAQAAAIADVGSSLARYLAALRQIEEARTISDALSARRDAIERRVLAGDDNRLSVAEVDVERAAAETARVEALESAQQALGALEDAVQRPLDGTADVELERWAP